jgi:hypothetical protein
MKAVKTLERRDPLVRAVLADMVESLGKATRNWGLANEVAETKAEYAISQVVECEIALRQVQSDAAKMRRILNHLADVLRQDAPMDK